MSNFKLSLPTDIPWERICVTEDMMDRVICDERLPAKWQTSLAVFKYRPDDANQLFPNYWITYLKITATITGYQPLDKEIQGQINWNGVNVATIPGLTDLLNSYNPCHGAILQVVVGPTERREDTPLAEYPFFLDFEPKKRELYELATDTKEKQSRSIESVNVTKSAGTTQSLEVFDIDMGGSTSFGMQGSYAGTGGGFNVSNSSQGQWGTKRMNSEEGMSGRTTEAGDEKRETFSFSTQISQMYHMLDSYHLGTNRAVFFIQPRPHTLEEPSGFVRGPRPVEGIQEFFMIVAQPRKHEDFCVAVRLDTSHLTRIPIMDYDRKSISTSIATANAPVATDHDIPAENIVGARACFIDCWDVHYQCYRTEARDTVTFNAPAGYRIEGYNNLINEATHGSTNVVVTPNGATLNINVEAQGHICYEGSEICANCPDTIQEWAGHARRQVQVNLVSTTPTKKVGEQEVLMITTRGLCCCANERLRSPNFTNEFVTTIKAIPEVLAPIRRASAYDTTTYLQSLAASTAAPVAAYQPLGAAPGGQQTSSYEGGGCSECAEKARTTYTAAAATWQAQAATPGYTIRQANELSNFIHTETLKSLNDPHVKPKKFIETEFFAKQLEYALIQTKKGRELVNRSAAEHLPERAIKNLAKRFRKKPEDVTLVDALALQGQELAEVSGLSEQEVQRFKLTTLGVTFHEDKSKGGRKPPTKAS
jgi:hypothetical protein